MYILQRTNIFFELKDMFNKHNIKYIISKKIKVVETRTPYANFMHLPQI